MMTELAGGRSHCVHVPAWSPEGAFKHGERPQGSFECLLAEVVRVGLVEQGTKLGPVSPGCLLNLPVMAAFRGAQLGKVAAQFRVNKPGALG